MEPCKPGGCQQRARSAGSQSRCSGEPAGIHGYCGGVVRPEVLVGIEARTAQDMIGAGTRSNRARSALITPFSGFSHAGKTVDHFIEMRRDA